MKCSFCKESSKDKDFICETKYWKVFLAYDQSNLGRYIVILKRHCGDLAELKEAEWIDFARLIKKTELALKKSFGAKMFNWSCLMNNAYQEKQPNPHVHWHCRPRYKQKIEFAGLVFKDPEFGHHYSRARKRKVPEEAAKKIVEKIKKSF